MTIFSGCNVLVRTWFWWKIDEMKHSQRDVPEFRCNSWDAVRAALSRARAAVGLAPGEQSWFRGTTSTQHQLLPSLFWRNQELKAKDLDLLEQDLFFEFQARARELHERGLTDWDVLFFMRHHGMPTRILDWTDSFGIALYFALDGYQGGVNPCIWVLNAFAMNGKTWFKNGSRDIVQPKYLGLIGDDFWDYGELLTATGQWQHDGPVAIYPLQISERMRAQRGWFTIHGNCSEPLEDQCPGCVVRIVLEPGVLQEARDFLELAALKPYAVYPDLDHLGVEIYQGAKAWFKDSEERPGRKPLRGERASQSSPVANRRLKAKR